MAMTKVWNISDDPASDTPPVNTVVLGKLLKPGRSVAVDEAVLKRAHKLKRDEKAGIVYIGKAPPADYLKRKNPPRAKLAPGVARTHGVILPKEAEAAVEKGVKKLDLIDTVKVHDEAAVELKPATSKVEVWATPKDEAEVATDTVNAETVKAHVEETSGSDSEDSKKKKRGR